MNRKWTSGSTSPGEVRKLLHPGSHDNFRAERDCRLRPFHVMAPVAI
jgi:hypothetical protein